MDLLLHVGLSNAVLATMLAVPAALAGLLRLRPALVHSLWLLVLLKLVTPPLVTWPVYEIPAEPVPAAAPPQPRETPPVFNLVVDAGEAAVPPLPDAPVPSQDPLPTVVADPRSSAETIPAPLPEKAPVASAAPAIERATPFRWQLWAVATWLIGSVGWFLLAAVRVRRFQRLLRLASPAPMELRDEVGILAKQLGLTRLPSVWLVPGDVSPMLWAAGGTARLLIPRDLLGRLSDAERETLLAHELAHLRRRDHWVRGLEFLATGLFWWHPIVLWARHGLREAEEQCCDAWVVWALPAAARAYATALVETIDFLSDARPVLPAAASGIGHVRLLKRRLTMILQGRTPRALSPAGLLTVLGLGAFLLPLLPTWSQADPPRSENQKAIKQIEDVIRTLKDDDKETREQLERALKSLKEKEETAGKAQAEEIARARADADQAATGLKGLVEQLKTAEERYQKAQKRLAELTGTPQDKLKYENHTIIRSRPGVDPWQAENQVEILMSQLKAKEAQLEEAVALLDQAKKGLERMKALQNQKAVAADDVDKVETQAKVAAAQLAGKQAEVEEAKAKLDQAKLAAGRDALRKLGTENMRFLVKPMAPMPVPPTDDRLKDLEKKLNELLHEVESLRKEVGRSATPAPPSKAAPMPR